MKLAEPGLLKLVVMTIFCVLMLGCFVSQPSTYAVSLAANPQTKNPLQPTEKNTALGLDHFDAHCASCHGLNGKADIEKGKAVKAADLTGDQVQSQSDPELFRKISSGVPGTAMPAFGKNHKPTEIWQTILFLRKLPTLTPEYRKKLEAAVPADARHKHPAGKDEHKHPESELQTQPKTNTHHEHSGQTPAKPTPNQPQPTESQTQQHQHHTPTAPGL